jgi:hypothetical protein
VHDDRLRSIVPLFGGGDTYVETLDETLAYVAEHRPTTEELLGWHRGHFAGVSSGDSIERRVGYLRAVGFLEQRDGTWSLGPRDILPGVNAGASHTVGMPVNHRHQNLWFWLAHETKSRERWQWVSTLETL